MASGVYRARSHRPYVNRPATRLIRRSTAPPFVPPFRLADTMDVIESHLLASGLFANRDVIGVPETAPSGSRMAVGVWEEGRRSADITAKLSMVYDLNIRIYRNAFTEPTESIELDMAKAVQLVAEDLLGDYTLGGTIRAIDVAGIYGTGMTATWGYAALPNAGGAIHRVVDLAVPLIVNDVATFAA